MAEIAPTRAHRYLALLACDGLITDIITTNDDCGLETAWRQARGPGLDDDWQAVASAEDLSRPRARHGKPVEVLGRDGDGYYVRFPSGDTETVAADEMDWRRN